MMAALLLGFYFAALGALAVLGLLRLASVPAALRDRAPAAGALPSPAPRLLVQIPLYDEALVAERVLRAAAALRYPRDRLLIQVLDDSEDATRAVVNRVSAELFEHGVPIEVVRRTGRIGYKAGALAAGLALRPEASLVALFDADFVPAPNFLEETIPVLLGSPELGMVQARWGHLNRDQNWLCRAQAVLLDGHFAVEHAARHARRHPFNFNGTAGIWRREAIDGAGGWSQDTLTEDLDLSYRAQLAGWRFAYLHEVVAPAELPERWSSFRSQQARWVRGSVQTARKLLWPILRSRSLRWTARAAATVHLLGNFAYLAMAALAVLLPPTLVVREELGWRVPGGRALLSGLDLGTLGAGTLAMVVFYGVAIHRSRSGFRPLDLGFALCVGAGMSLTNAVEVLRGLLLGPGVFVRTPKRGSGRGQGLYRVPARPLMVAAELSLAALYGALLVHVLETQVWGALPFVLLYLVGFSAVGGGTALEAMGSLSASETRPGSPPSIRPAPQRAHPGSTTAPEVGGTAGRTAPRGRESG